MYANPTGYSFQPAEGPTTMLYGGCQLVPSVGSLTFQELQQQQQQLLTLLSSQQQTFQQDMGSTNQQHTPTSSGSQLAASTMFLYQFPPTSAACQTLQPTSAADGQMLPQSTVTSQTGQLPHSTADNIVPISSYSGGQICVASGQMLQETFTSLSQTPEQVYGGWVMSQPDLSAGHTAQQQPGLFGSHAAAQPDSSSDETRQEGGVYVCQPQAGYQQALEDASQSPWMAPYSCYPGEPAADQLGEVYPYLSLPGLPGSDYLLVQMIPVPPILG
jgi:type II secretory pathway pseudopilin PulG